MTALMLPIALMVTGGAIDAYLVMSQRQRLQDAVDMSALAAARELGLSDARRENVPAVVEAMVSAMMSGNSRGATSPRLTTTVGNEPLEVAVEARSRPLRISAGCSGSARGTSASPPSPASSVDLTSACSGSNPPRPAPFRWKKMPASPARTARSTRIRKATMG